LDSGVGAESFSARRSFFPVLSGTALRIVSVMLGIAQPPISPAKTTFFGRIFLLRT
jgi:hypothetical protein